MLPNLPSLPRPRCGDGDPGRRLHQGGREIKMQFLQQRGCPERGVPGGQPTGRGDLGSSIGAAPRGKARGGDRAPHGRIPPARLSPSLTEAAQSRCSSSSAREEADGDGAGSDLPAGAGGKAGQRFFLAVAVSQRGSPSPASCGT